MRVMAVLVVFSLALQGCGPSTENIGAAVTSSMQQKFDSDPTFKQFHMKVSEVQVVKLGGNRYQGMAHIEYGGTQHEVPLDITADGKNVLWQAQPGAFLFATPSDSIEKVDCEPKAWDRHVPKDLVDGAQVEMGQIAQTLDLFKLEIGRYPTSREGLQALVTKPPGVNDWHGPYWRAKKIKDPWGNDYGYIVPGRNCPFDLISFGADGVAGGGGPNRDIAYRR